MNFGTFDSDHQEYRIHRPDTPRPWSNYLGSAEFGGVITNNAAGYTFYKSAAQGRLTRFQFNGTPAEWCGRYLYVTEEDGDFWSASWLPVGKPLDVFKSECAHAPGCTRIRSVYREVEIEVTYFIPLGETFEVWDVRVTNKSGKARRLKLFPFVEPQCNYSAEDDGKNLQYNQYISSTRLAAPGLIDIGSNINMPEDPDHFTNKDQKRHRFFGLTGMAATNFDADLECFIGRHGSKAKPAAVVQGCCRGSEAGGDMPCGAFELDVALDADEEMCFACLFGVGEAEKEGLAIQTAMADVSSRKEALAKVKRFWSERLNTLQVETPDTSFNDMANLWAPFNSLMTFYWSRTASLVYAGERDGLGYRDTLQDIVAAASLVTEEAQESLELLITGQYANGGCKPVVQPFEHCPGSEQEPDAYRSDDGLWLFNAVPAYVNETGDTDFYQKILPFADQGEATVLGHLRRALDFNLERCGSHGLPCGLHADWNDCVRLGEKGESVFVAFQLRFGLEVYQKLCSRFQKTTEAEWAADMLSDFDRRLERYAWDGEWYLRAYRFDGMKFGSRENEEGRIFMNPQTWSVLSGHAQGERAHQVMESLHRELNTPYGVILCAPPYVSTDPQVCLARLFNPGMKENAGIFNHTQGWGILALAKLGMGDRAYEYLMNVLPSSFNDRAELREVEPYAVCQSTHSRYSPREGTGRVSWLSGSATWNYVAMVQGILGLCPTEDGLKIDPCIPSAWKTFKVVRRFRGREIHIEVKNPHARSKGVRRLEVNGEWIPGNHLQLSPKGTGKIEVVAVLEASGD
ncbi:N,N'-diacetylchitobiose phosphorylase [Kiritimatiellaeota bacterium B1221]|nr:N,N'-diacetylchitobiose phosphorylase [Kiritimatiellaeota bacterium B1221]